MINEKLKRVYSYLKTIKAPNPYIIALILIVFVIFSYTVYGNYVFLKKLQTLEKQIPTLEEQKLLEIKNKMENSRIKTLEAEKKKREAEEDMKKYKSFEECYLGQIDRILEGKETLVDYCDMNFGKEKETSFIIPKAKAEFKEEKKYWFTDYDLGDVNQNDSTPCIGASGKNLCKMYKEGIKTIALVNIKRRELGINFGDKVKLVGGPCEGIYEVHDEMNERFRQKRAIYKPGTNYEIRGDIARYKSKEKCSGPYEIQKI